MSDAKATITYLNGLTLRTINEVEKILLSLPSHGQKCELETVKPVKTCQRGRGTAEVVASKSMKIRDVPKPLTISPREQQQNTSDSCSSLKSSKPCSASSSSRNSYGYGRKRQVEYRSLASVAEEKAAAPASPPMSSSTPNYKILTDKVRVSPIVSMNGVILDIDVEITMPETNEKKLVKLQIECPNYIPARIKIGGKWKKIV